jgi:hypothetical protein
VSMWTSAYSAGNDNAWLRGAAGRYWPVPGRHPRWVLEATYGWDRASDTLAELGAVVHLDHPLGVKAFEYRRVKNDERDAADLADLLRGGWSAARGVDRATGDPGAAGVGAASGEAGWRRTARPRCTRCWPRAVSMCQ